MPKAGEPAVARGWAGSNLTMNVQPPINRPVYDARKRSIAMAVANKEDNRRRWPTVVVRPLRTAVLYAVLAGAWIAGNSVIFALALEHRLEADAFVEIGKGFGFVAATGVLLYLILERIRRRLQAVQDSLDESRETTEAQRRRIERIAKIGHWVWQADPGIYDWAGGRSEYSSRRRRFLACRRRILRSATGTM